jgi:hypothetical protein
MTGVPLPPDPRRLGISFCDETGLSGKVAFIASGASSIVTASAAEWSNKALKCGSRIEPIDDALVGAAAQ